MDLVTNWRQTFLTVISEIYFTGSFKGNNTRTSIYCLVVCKDEWRVKQSNSLKEANIMQLFGGILTPSL